MPNYCILRIKKLHTNANIGGAVSHHLRTRETENADDERISKNFFFPNSPLLIDGKYIGENNTKKELRLKVQKMAMAMYKKNLPEKIRKNAVRAVEFMMTVSPEVMNKKEFNVRKYLTECTNWVRDKFGSENIFFIAKHFDETTPHVSILLTPKDENGKLNARKFFGGREKMSLLQDDFYNEVGKKFSLDRGIKGSKSRHQTIKQYYTKLNEKDRDFSKIEQAVLKQIPAKKIIQSSEEYRKEVCHIVKQEVAKLKPVARTAVASEQTERRYKNLQDIFWSEVRKKSSKFVAEVVQEEIGKLSAENKKLREENGRLRFSKYSNEQKMQEAKTEADYIKKDLERWRSYTPEDLRRLANDYECLGARNYFDVNRKKNQRQEREPRKEIDKGYGLGF